MFIIRYERKTQPMKRLLVLLPLLLVGCTNDKISDNSHTNSKVYQNVWYNFEIEEHCYKVYYNKETYNVPPSNFYEIKLSEYAYTEEHTLLENEYFVSTNELFVYYRQ